MTEKIESMEIHPMRGHSRGEWYCSMEDVVQSEEEAEYWAVFGTTHRGNKHCLGEFPSKAAAEAAAHGMKSLWTRSPREPSQAGREIFQQGRRVIQIEVVADKNDSAMADIFALCNDGTIWRRGVGTGRHAGLIDNQWEQIGLDGLEELGVGEAFGAFIQSSH